MSTYRVETVAAEDEQGFCTWTLSTIPTGAGFPGFREATGLSLDEAHGRADQLFRTGSPARIVDESTCEVRFDPRLLGG